MASSPGSWDCQAQHRLRALSTITGLRFLSFLPGPEQAWGGLVWLLCIAVFVIVHISWGHLRLFLTLLTLVDLCVPALKHIVKEKLLPVNGPDFCNAVVWL